MNDLKNSVKKLRKKGKTYSEIKQILDIFIPKSTLSDWCKNISLPKSYFKKIKVINVKSQKRALKAWKQKKELKVAKIIDRNKHLSPLLKNRDIALIALSLLYLGEGSKTKRGSLTFGNSDPFIIDMFLDLLRRCYEIDNSKFRCTVQCRADQDTKKLEKFWSKITKIPLSQFYEARIDKRTIGKKSIKPEYKGVCRIDYFSADIFTELMKLPRIIHTGP
jgi:hypothetical protein